MESLVPAATPMMHGRPCRTGQRPAKIGCKTAGVNPMACVFTVHVFYSTSSVITQIQTVLIYIQADVLHHRRIHFLSMLCNIGC